jgi:hypothetical protein
MSLKSEGLDDDSGNTESEIERGVERERGRMCWGLLKSSKYVEDS